MYINSELMFAVREYTFADCGYMFADREQKLYRG